MLLKRRANEPMSQNEFAKIIKQHELINTIETIEQKMEYACPSLDHYPPEWTDDRKRTFARTNHDCRNARGGTLLWFLGGSFIGARSGQPYNLSLTEAQWAAACRQQMGVGFEGIAGRQPHQRCSCHNAPDPPDNDLETCVDWHIRGCPRGHGHINRTHKIVQEELKAHLKAGGWHFLPLDISIPPQKGKFMADIRVQNPQGGTALVIDLTRRDPYCKTYIDQATTTKSARECAFASGLSSKARKYQHAVDYHKEKLFTFGFDSHGAFAPREVSKSSTPGLDPTPLLARLYPNGAPPQGDTIGHSAEEQLIKLVSLDAARRDRGHPGAFDARLATRAAAGMFTREKLRMLAYKAIRGSARAHLASIRRLRH